MIFGLKTPEKREREEQEERERNTNKHTPLETHPRWTHTQRKKTHPSSRARRGYSVDPSLILTDPSLVLVLHQSIPRSQGSHRKIDQTIVSPWPVNDPPLFQSDRHEQPTPEPICLPCVQPTPRSNHPVSDPLLDQAATFRSTHYVRVATTVTTTKSPTNRSLSLSLSLNLSLSLSHDWSCDFDFCFFDCLYILILCNNICLDPKKMWETQ